VPVHGCGAFIEAMECSHVPILDYQISPKEPPDRKARFKKLFMFLPALLMVLAGLPCCFVSAFMGDSPEVVLGPPFYIAFGLTALTGPIGCVTGLFSERLAKARGPVWLWLNWAVFVVHFGAIVVLLQFVKR
jgi:hypothetical protein